MFEQEFISVPETLIGFNFLQTARGEYYFSYISVDKKGEIPVFEYNIISKRGLHGEKWKRIKRINISEKIGVRISQIIGFSQLVENRGELMIFISFRDEKEQIHVYIVQSHDYGKNWYRVRKVSDEFSAWRVSHTPLLMEKSMKFGNIYVPMEDLNTGGVFLLISENNGENWDSSLDIDGEFDGESADDRLIQLKEPGVFERKDHSIVITFKKSNKKDIYAALSGDFGYTWEDYYSLKGLDRLIDGPYDIKNYKIGNIEVQPFMELTDVILLMGAIFSESRGTYHSALWVSSDEGKIFYPFWISDYPIEDLKLADFLISQDLQSIIHLFSRKNSSVIEHSWGVIDVR